MKTLAIVGNGASRVSLEKEITSFEEIWVCNRAYTEIEAFPNIKRVYSVHPEVVEEALDERKTKGYSFIIYGRQCPPADFSFSLDLGWSSGNQALLDALLDEQYEKIYLYGFDFGGKDIYQSHLLEGSNFKKQFEDLKTRALKFDERVVLRYPEKLDNSNVMFATMLDDNFLPGFKGFIKSLFIHNPDFKYPITVINNGLSIESKKEMKGLYPALIFRDIDKDKYDFPKESTSKELISTYYKLEVFNKAIYGDSTDRVIFLDMDILIQGSLKDLISFDLKGKPFAACQQYQRKTDSLISQINSGVFIIDLHYLKKSDYKNLIELCKQGSYLPDQDILNRYFVKTDNCSYLPKTFNVEKRMVASEKFQDFYQTATIIHYVNTKPWNSEAKEETEYLPVYQKWWNLFQQELEIRKKEIDLGTKNYSLEELRDFLEELGPEGKISGKGISYQMSSNCGKLVILLKRKPIISIRDDTWLFYIDENRKSNHVYEEESSDEQYKEFLRDKKVIFVGPSPILEGSALGSFIDSFDVVVRTNNMLNTLINNPLLQKDYGSKTDILYVNVTYERDNLKEWQIDKWKERDLRYLCKMMYCSPKLPLCFKWRNIPNRHPNEPPPTLFIGTRLISDLLAYPISELYVTGIDGYASISEVLDGKNSEYVFGYLPDFTLRQREKSIGGPVSLHDKYRDTRLILEMMKDRRLSIDKESLILMKKVAYGKD